MYRLQLKWMLLVLLLMGSITTYAAQPAHINEPTPHLAADDVSAHILCTRLTYESNFYGNRDWTKRAGLPRMDMGGRLAITLLNTSQNNLSIIDIALHDKTFSQLTSQATSSPTVADTKWVHVVPNPVLPGKTGTITIRMANIYTDLPANATLSIETTRGMLTFAPPDFSPQTSDLWIPSLNVSPDMNTTTLFVANRGTQPLVLPTTGGVAVNGTAINGTMPHNTLAAGEVVPITLANTGGLLTLGEHAAFAVTTADNTTTACAGLRVFPYHFTTQSHMQGSNYDAQDRAKHFVGDWDESVAEVTDEPSSSGKTPMDVAQEVDTWYNKNPQQNAIRPSIVHNTSYLEGLVYDDIADIANSHWGTVRQELATFVTWPKVNWYMPQNTWGTNEGLYRREHWYPLEDTTFQALEAVGHGAKSVQWFLYQNHWQQGWGRHEGTDFGRVMPDKNRSGHIANPLLWNRIGRTSGILDIAAPYLTNSAPYTSFDNAKHIEVNVLVSKNTHVDGTYKAVLLLMDHRTPRYGHVTGHIFRYDVPTWRQQVLYNQPIGVTLPDYIYQVIDTAYVIDPWLGIEAVPLLKSPNSYVSFTLPEIQTGALVILGNAADADPLQQAWNAKKAAFDTYDDVRSAMMTRANQQPSGEWHYPEDAYRQQFTVKNSAAQPADTIALPVDFSAERAYNATDVRVVEIDDNTARYPHFFVDGTRTYETYQSPDTLNRVKAGCEGNTPGGTSPEGCSYDMLLGTGVLNLISTYKAAGFVWGIDTVESMPVIPWTTDEGYPDRWIPARFGTLAIDANITPFPWWWWNRVTFYFDVNNDGIVDTSRGFQLYEESHAKYDVGNGMMRFIFDMQQVFQHESLYPNEPLRGQYRFGYQHYLQPNWLLPEVAYYWSLDNVQATGNQVIIAPTTPLGAGETRTYVVYYDVQENSHDTITERLDSSLIHRTPDPDVVVTSHDVEYAGATVALEGITVKITTQARTRSILFRHLGNDGSIVSAKTITLANEGNSFKTTLTRPMQASEFLVVIPIQRSGEGEIALFNSEGEPLSGNVQHMEVVPATWVHNVAEFATSDSSVYPTSVDISSDGMLVAVGMVRVQNDRSNTTGLVRVLNSTSGAVVWQQDLPGKVFQVRFQPDTYALYVAANVGEDVIDSSDFVLGMYEDTRIIKYTNTGAEDWQHTVGDNTNIPYKGRTVFDMEVYPNGDLLYSEWNSYGVKLNGETGAVVWAVDTAHSATTYTPAVVPLDDGGALLLGFYSKHVAADGTVRNSVFVNDEPYFDIDGSRNGTTWAFTGNLLRILTALPTGVNYRISGTGSTMTTLPQGIAAGRYPRVVRVSDDGAFIATGSSDGLLTLFSSTKQTLWTKEMGGSYVTDIAFLPNNNGVVFSREVFDYQHDNYQADNNQNGWRFRDMVEAYTLNGDFLWQHEGRWRDGSLSEPFMSQIAFNSDGTRLVVLSGEEVRSVNLTAQLVPNSTLYPVENVLGVGAIKPPVPPSTITFNAPTYAVVNGSYVFDVEVLPTSTSVPIDYTWYISGENTVARNDIASTHDRLSYSWHTTGTREVFVVGINAYGTVTSTIQSVQVVPSPVITLDKHIAAPKSYFLLTGSNYPPNIELNITINELKAATIRTDNQGTFLVVLDTNEARFGEYNVMVTFVQKPNNINRYEQFLLSDSAAFDGSYPNGAVLVKVVPQVILLPIVTK